MAIADISYIQLEINQLDFRLERRFLGWHFQKFHRCMQEIDRIELQEMKLLKNSKYYTVCMVISNLCYRDVPGIFGTQTDSYGLFLTREEQEWLVGEIRAFMEEFPASRFPITGVRVKEVNGKT